MRSVFLGIVCLLMLFSCSPKAYFKTSNDAKEMYGVVYMDDGQVKKGFITVSFENIHERDNEIIFKTDKDAANESLDVKEISYYTINGHTYLPKIINLHLSNEYHYLFVERLTAERDKMQLYKLIPSANTNFAGEEPSYYYISFPSFTKYEVIDINSSKLVPEFDIKMSNYIKDCAALVTKVQLKDKGYYYALFSLGAKRVEVIKNIVKEYNNCQ